MAFRYTNPGYVALLSEGNSATEVTGTTYSKSGVGFYQTDFPSNKRNIALPAFVQGNDDFWIKFDVYIPSTDNEINIFCVFPNYIGFSLIMRLMSWYNTNSSYTVCYQYFSGYQYSGTAQASLSAMGIKQETVNSFVIHVKYGDQSTGKIELITPSGLKLTCNNTRNLDDTSEYYKSAHLYCSNSAVIFSNIICSNEELSIKEKIIALPIGATETNMTAGASGIYIADAANQTLLQSLDVSTLIENYGASSAITGIELVGNPAYKTAEGLANLTALSKADGVVTEYNTHTLSANTSAIVMDGRTIDNMTIADLQDMQFGWKVGK